MRFFATLLVAALVTQVIVAQQKSLPVDLAQGVKSEPKPPGNERFVFGVEWRLIRAGVVTMEIHKNGATLQLDSSGLVSALFKIQDVYRVNFEDNYCASSSLMDAREGKRHGETRVTYDRAQNKAIFSQRDVITGKTVRESTIDTPACVGDVMATLTRLRAANLEIGKTVDLPMSDGRKAALVRVEAQEKEEVKTPAGTFKAIRYEANLLNGVIYTRAGRAFIWLTDDARHMPVQIRLRMNFPVGTVSLQLEKEERS